MINNSYKDALYRSVLVDQNPVEDPIVSAVTNAALLAGYWSLVRIRYDTETGIVVYRPVLEETTVGGYTTIKGAENADPDHMVGGHGNPRYRGLIKAVYDKTTGTLIYLPYDPTEERENGRRRNTPFRDAQTDESDN